MNQVKKKNRLNPFKIPVRDYNNVTVETVVTLPLGDINTEVWSSGMGVGRGANNPPL
jgi:hypothetical protein